MSVTRSRVAAACLLALAGCGDSFDPDQRLVVGEWGSSSALLIALRSGAEVRFACTAVIIEEAIELRDDNTFAFRGWYDDAVLSDAQPPIRAVGTLGESGVSLRFTLRASDMPENLVLEPGVTPDFSEIVCVA